VELDRDDAEDRRQATIVGEEVQPGGSDAGSTKLDESILPICTPLSHNRCCSR
jgi:hypothetical protein